MIDEIKNSVKTIQNSNSKETVKEIDEKNKTQEKTRQVELLNIKVKPKICLHSSCCIIKIVAIFGVIVVFLLGLYYGVMKAKKKYEEIEKKEGDNEPKENDINEKLFIIKKYEAMKIFQRKFKVVSKVDTLNQLLCKSTKKYNTITNGIESTYSFFTKAKYDIFTLNEKPSGDDKDFYTNKYSTAITINSYCIKSSSNSEEGDCELETYLDLNAKETRNLRRNDEVNEEEILKQAIIPLCLIEHTDTNLILSVTCPENLSINLKNDILLAFKTIKPETVREMNETEEYTGTTIEKRDNKIYIEIYSKDCEDYKKKIL